ncbi:Multiple C2 and transmembrane domain-containing protein 1 [Papilio xuthus]|uniref:Multiple C2 and transmembrane domain-containing protein 1 n=1 Tax=Papilio xuthus TaxID=66420 RepID=A0A0N0P9T6_PAPXU|nr:Multiple C2 and transmembrane domain-containing protein 1 [Papilio xuthus]
MERLKNRLIKIHGKIQDTVEDIQDHVQTKIERSRLASFVSHLSEDRKSFDSDKSIDSNDKVNSNIPSVVINEPIDGVNDEKEICRNFIKMESNGAIYRSLSDSDLAFENETHFDSSSDSCTSWLSSDERNSEIRPRAGSCPPGEKLDVSSSCDLIEKISNRFPGLRSNEKYKSKVVWKSLHPSWLEQFDLHLYDDQEQILEVTVWDKDKQTKDDFLGRCTIDLSTLEREKTHNIWQDLEDGNGQIFLLLTISGTTQSETITDLTSYKENPRDIEIIERRYAWYRLNEHSSGVGWLCVKVYGAKGLAAADLGGKSDPFCVLELGNARLQTHTEYKTLTPNWMKIFTFTVKDITSILEITVYDEDHDHKVEFLGKLAIPLLNIRNGEKRWFALKDKKMRARAKGNYPQILLEMMVIWNPLKAAIRVINPKEPKYMHQESKFKRQLFIRNVMRLKAIIMWFIEVGKILQDCFEWESRFRSFLGLLAWLAFCYYYQMWMLPFLLLVFFSRNWLIYRLTAYVVFQSMFYIYAKFQQDPSSRSRDIFKQTSIHQNIRIYNISKIIHLYCLFSVNILYLMNFTVPCLSYLAILMLFGAMLVLYVIPLRYLLMAWGINKFTRKILRPHTIPNNEVLDLLSRVPDDEILLDCRELKPHPANEARRDARKKHKAA